MEEDFEIAAISAGLMERVADVLTRRYNNPFPGDKVHI